MAGRAPNLASSMKVPKPAHRKKINNKVNNNYEPIPGLSVTQAATQTATAHSTTPHTTAVTAAPTIALAPQSIAPRSPNKIPAGDMTVVPQEIREVLSPQPRAGKTGSNEYGPIPDIAAAAGGITAPAGVDLGLKANEGSPTAPEPPPPEEDEVDEMLDFCPGLDDLLKEDWYHGSLPLEDIRGLLERDGDFLLRLLESDGERPKQPCLSVQWKGIQNYPMFALKEHPKDPYCFTIDGELKEKTIIDCVKAHMAKNLPVQASAGVMLLNPICRPDWELAKDMITIKDKLGEGAFGEVFSGKLRLKAREPFDVALKCIKVGKENKQAMEEMLKEARLMRQYNHRNIIMSHGMVVEPGRVTIVMELVHGGGLDNYIRKKNPPAKIKLSFCSDIACGLAYLHEKKCMHRDIACRNMLVDEPRLVCKISDFGLSKQSETYRITADEKTPVRWLAPEVIKSHVYTREADTWAFGITCWEIWNGAQQPFAGMKNRDIKEGLLRTLRPPPPPASEGCPPNVMTLLMTNKGCLNGDPVKRVKMQQVMFALNDYNIHKPVKAKPPPSRPTVLPPAIGLPSIPMPVASSPRFKLTAVVGRRNRDKQEPSAGNMRTACRPNK